MSTNKQTVAWQDGHGYEHSVSVANNGTKQQVAHTVEKYTPNKQEYAHVAAGTQTSRKGGKVKHTTYSCASSSSSSQSLH